MQELTVLSFSACLVRCSHLPKPFCRATVKGIMSGLEDDASRAKQLAEALHNLQRSQAVGESGIEALHAEGDVHELDNTIVGADATIKAWRFMQVCCLHRLYSLQLYLL